MTSLYLEGHTLFQQVRNRDMDAEILARQTAGYYLTNHNRYHDLNGGNPPCKGFGNWLLWHVASVLAPGFSGKVPNSAPGGSFIEGVIWEWMVDEDPALGTQGTKLQKCPEKAKLFEEIAGCLNLLRILPTNVLGF